MAIMDELRDEFPRRPREEDLSFIDRAELLTYMRNFGDAGVTARADRDAMELHADMAQAARRLAVAMYKIGEIEAPEFDVTIEAIHGQITLDQAREWAEELEADIATKQLTGELPDDEEMEAALEEALRPPVLSISAMVEAQIRALHEQAGLYGMTADEVAEAEEEIRRDALELERAEAEEEGDERWTA